MHHIAAGLADKPIDAQRIVDALVDHACDRSHISLMAAEKAGAAGRASSKAVLQAVSAIATREVSGFGVLRAVGALGGVLTRYGLASLEDLAASLTDLGIHGQLAMRYAEALRSGKILIVVHAPSADAQQRAAALLAEHGVAVPFEGLSRRRRVPAEMRPGGRRQTDPPTPYWG